MVVNFESIKRFYKTSGIGKAIDFVFAASYIYLIWIVVHYLSAHLYTRWCVPPTIIGFILAPFLIPLLFLMTSGPKHKWISSKVRKIFQNQIH